MKEGGYVTEWSESLAAGGEEFLEGVKAGFGTKNRYREAAPAGGVDGHPLREPATPRNRWPRRRMFPMVSDSGKCALWLHEAAAVGASGLVCRVPGSSAATARAACIDGGRESVDGPNDVQGAW